MKSPFVVSLLSVIPGLGFFVLKRPKIGLGIIGALFLCIVVFLFSANEMIYTFAFQFGFFIWLIQIAAAFREARRQIRIENGEASAPLNANNDDFIMPTDLAEKKKIVRDAYKFIKQQAEAGEEIYHTILAQVFPSVGSLLLFGNLSLISMDQMYIGFTSKGLLMVKLDMMGKPGEVKRMDYAEIKSMNYSKGLLYDRLQVFTSEKKGMTWKVHFLFRDQTQQIAQKYTPQAVEA